MNDQLRERIALERYKIISPVLAEPARLQNEYFRAQAKLVHDFPHYGKREVSVSTLKLWLKRYKTLGFDGLKPKGRDDAGRSRIIGAKQLDAIRVKCKAFPTWTIKQLYHNLVAEKQIGDPPVSYQTVLRIVTVEGLRPKKTRTDVRKRFEMYRINELWVADFMHGPKVRTSAQRLVGAILCAIIDDHSRMIVGWRWNTSETISVLTEVFKEALGAFGIPKRFYADNGPAFSADLLVSCCAGAGISLIHSKPYDAASRGKVERFFRSLRQRFIPNLNGELTLEELNNAFAAWLRDQYHHAHHEGIDGRPIDRYTASSAATDIRRLASAELDELFLVRLERTVNNDATITFKSRIYEVPAAYIRQKIELRHPVGDDATLTLYDNGVKVARLALVDTKNNARTFTPERSKTAVSFSREEVES
jgi:putative transposase